MSALNEDPGTGFASLDRVLQGLSKGDNVVWQVDSVHAYRPLVRAFCAKALDTGRRVVYFRFATHAPLVAEDEVTDICYLQAARGFDIFVAETQDVVRNAGREAVYVFDCLSELAEDWCSDRMLGNFFMLTCPYVFERGAAAYFALIRNRHSFHAIEPVRDTTQVMIDVHRLDDRLYIHPLKVQYRQAEQMHMFYRLDGDTFVPVTRSAEVADVAVSDPRSPLDSTGWRLGFWSSTFAKAEELAAASAAGQPIPGDTAAFVTQLRRMMFAREGRMLELAERHLDLNDILTVRRRMIGTGPIGGKATGLVLAQTVLRRADPRWRDRLEPPDSFFIGADVFYTYLVQNGLWWSRHRQKDPVSFLDGLELVRHQILKGSFPDYILRQFSEVLDYFGQAPIVVRSSSLLEDDFSHSFAGKGESVLCANQGSHGKRMTEFVSAVRRVYASCMSEDTLRYRASRGLLQHDEQMAILVQRVSGGRYGNLFFPHVAGVGLSFNPYAWDSRIDPDAGVMRLVFGLGTRAVTPHPDDYTRVVPLDMPELHIEPGEDDDTPYAQRWVDVLDLTAGRVRSVEFRQLTDEHPDLPVDLLAPTDKRLERLARETGGRGPVPRSLTFDPLLRSSFVDDVAALLRELAHVYGVPVDVEFASSFTEDGNYRLNLLQCRPMTAGQAPGSGTDSSDVADRRTVVESAGPVLGHSRSVEMDCLVYIVPAVYGSLPMRDRFSVARTLGELMRRRREAAGGAMLIGPGRWGTTSPSLGVPVSFAELHGARVLCEVEAMHEGLKPELSLGSHFFNELVETGMLYVAIHPGRDGHSIDEDFFLDSPNHLTDYVPDASDWRHAIRVVEASPSQCLRLNADTHGQRVTVYVADRDASESSSAEGVGSEG